MSRRSFGFHSSLIDAARLRGRAVFNPAWLPVYVRPHEACAAHAAVGSAQSAEPLTGCPWVGFRNVPCVIGSLQGAGEPALTITVPLSVRPSGTVPSAAA